MKKRILSIITSLALCLSLLPTVSLPAAAAETGTGKAIQLGTGGISGYDSTNGYDYIHYGTWDDSPIKWRVLDDQTNTGDSGLFLLSDILLRTDPLFFDDSEPFSNEWQGSTAQAWCKDFAGEEGAATNATDAFTAGERGAVLAATKHDPVHTSHSNFVQFSGGYILNSDKVFFLSAEEAENSAYGFTDDNARVAYHGASAGKWWLRSPVANQTDYAGAVNDDGVVSPNRVDGDYRARPAFNLDPSSVLFMSAADNSGHNSSFAAPADYDGSEWKVTLKDDKDFSMGASVSGSTTLVAGYSDAALTINHGELGNFLTPEYTTYTNVTAMLTNESGDILYYGSINNDIWAKSSTVTIPAGLPAGEYTLSVYGEDWNGENCTDYATGTPLTTTITVHEHSWKDMPDGGQVCTDCGYTFYDLWVGGVQVAGVPDENGKITVTGDTITGTVTLTPATGTADVIATSVLENAPTLTLSDAAITAATTPVDVDYGNTPPCGVYSRSALNLVLTGANTITADTTEDSAGVMADARDLAISGSGSLEIDGCGYGISALKLTIDGVTVEIIGSVYAIWLNMGCTIEESTVSAVGSNTGISTTTGTMKIDNSSVYAKGEQYSLYGLDDGVFVDLDRGAHVKAEGAIKIGSGVRSFRVGYLRTASNGLFAGKDAGSLETSGSYFEFVCYGHYKDLATIDGEEHSIECQDGNCLLKLTNAYAPHRWIANGNGADCADCPANADASVTTNGTTDYYVFVDNAVLAADGNSNAVLKLFDNEDSITVEQGGFTLDPNGKSIETLNFKSGSSSIDIASQPGNAPAVTMEAPGVFATPSGGAELEADWFTSATTGYVVVKEGDDLKLTKGITEDMVTVVQSATYNGSIQTPTVTVRWTNGMIFVEDMVENQDYNVVYTDSEGDQVFPTNAGTYTVVITGINNYAGVVEKKDVYTINKADAPTITWPTADGLTYGQTLADSALSDSSTEYGSFAWKNTSTVPTVGNTGYPVTFTANEDTIKNYQTITTTEQNVQVNVTQAAPGISLSASVSGASGNRTVELTATMSAAGSGDLPTGTVKFVNITDGGTTEIGTANISNGTATCTWTATEDKAYTFQAVYNGDTNYTTKTAEKTVDTSKQPQAALTIISGTTVTYGQTLTLTTTGGTTNGTVTYTVTPSNVAAVSGNVLTPAKVGSVTVTATMAGNDTYLDVTSAPITITITQATGTGSVSMAGWTYGETASNPVPTSTTNGAGSVTYLYKAKGADDSTYTATKPTDAGTYTVKATFAATDNYTEATATADFTITGAAQTAPSAPEQDSKTYHSVTLKAIAANANGAAAEYSKDGGATWQSSPSFTGLSASTKYNFAARYAAVGNYAASPASAVTEITTDAAPYTGGGSTGGGSSSSTPSTPIVSTGDKTEGGTTTTTTTATPNATTKGDTATAAVSTSVGKEIVEQAKENGSTEVVVAPDVTGNVSKTEVSIPASTVESIGSKTAANLTVSTPVADVSIPNGGLSDLASAGGTVTVTAEKVGNQVTLEVTAGGEAVSEVTGGITLTVPHDDCDPGTVAVLVHEDGSREVVRKSVADDGTLTVTIPLTGSATLELVDNATVFEDVADDAWYSDAADFVSARGLFGGVGDTAAIFDGNSSMTRGMLAVVLHRLENNPDHAFTGSFDDVPERSWYGEAIHWMAEAGIAGGYGNGDFGAEDDITREQLAVMLWRYAGSPAPKGTALNFTDAGEVGSWAVDALIWAQENGIMQGNNNAVNPKGTATRAHVAQMLKNFMENIMK